MNPGSDAGDGTVGRRFVRGTAAVLPGLVVGSAAGFGARTLAARHLPPDQYGHVVVGVAVTNLAALVVLLGTHEGLARQLGAAERPAELFSGTLVVVLTLAVGAAAGLLAVREPLLGLVGAREAAPVVAPFVVAIPAQAVVRLVVGGLRGRERASGKVVVQNLGVQAVRLVAVLAAVAGGAGLGLLAAAWVGPLFVGALVALALSWRTDLLTLGLSRRALRTAVPDLLRFSAPLVVSGTVWLLLKYTDTIAVEAFRSSGSVGLYGAAFTLGEVFLLLPVAFGYLFVPRFAAHARAADADAMAALYGAASKWMALAAVPAYALLVLHPGAVLGVVFGPSYRAADLALVVVATGLFVHVVFGLGGHAVVALGEPRRLLAGNLVALGANVVLNVVLVPRFGIAGAAAASAAGYGLATAYWTGHLLARTGLHPVGARMVVPAVGALATCGLVGRWLTVAGAGGVLAASAAYGGVLVAWATIAGVGDDEVAVAARLDEDAPVDLGPLVAVLRAGARLGPPVVRTE